jgi:hypothetical protein
MHPTRLLPFLLWTLSFLDLDAKGGERVDSGGVVREGFGFLALCVLLSCIMFIFPHLYYVSCVLVRYLSNMLIILSLLYHVT